MRRSLPSAEEAAAIIAAKRTRRIPPPPPAAGRSLAPTIKALDARFGKGPEALAARWREIVGEVLARRTEPVKLVRPRGAAAAAGGASLELRVDGPSAAIIQHQAQDIMARVNLFLGEGAVTKLRIVQGPLRGAADAPPSRRRVRTPLDAAAEKSLAESLNPLPDGPLKAALSRLGREVLRGGARQA